MKTKLLALIMILGFCVASKAQLNQKKLPEQKSTEMIAQNTNPSGSQTEITNTVVNETKTPTSPNPIQSLFSEQKKKKGKIKTWQYIVGGIVVVAIVVFAIVAPNGYNSRTGI